MSHLGRTTAASALLTQGVAMLHERGPAHPLHHIGVRDLAERAGLAESSVRRIARPMSAFRDVALAHGVHRLPAAKSTMDLWAKLRSGRDHPAESAVEHGLRLHETVEVPVSRLTAWANAHRPHVGEQVAHVLHVFRGVLATELGARWRDGRMAPIVADAGQPTADALILASGIGGPLTLNPRPDATDANPRGAVRLLAYTYLATSEPGEWIGDVPDIPNPVIEAPFVDQAQVPLVEALLAIVQELGPAAPADHLTIRSVSDAAGVSAGSIYGMWDDMAHYRRSVVAEHLRLARTNLDRAVAGTPDSATIAGALARCVDGAVHQVLLSSMASADAAYSDVAADHLIELESTLAEPLGSHDAAQDVVAVALGAATLMGIDGALLSGDGDVSTAGAIRRFLDLRQSPQWGVA